MASSLKAKSIVALAWSTAEQVGVQGVRFLLGIILARLLTPGDYGLVGMVAVFMGISHAFVDSGFGPALIQRRDANEEDEASVFYFNIILGAGIAAILCVASPAIALFYKQPQLTLLTRLLALDIIINSFVIVQASLLSKKLDFASQMKATVVSLIVGGIVGIWCAATGQGVISLVAQLLVSDGLRAALLWRLSDWRPRGRPTISALKRLHAFGSRLFIGNLMATALENIYSLIIGRWYSASSLGFYSRARQMQQLPATNMHYIVSRVGFPALCELQNNPGRMKQALRKILTMIALVHFPVMTFIGVTAVPLITVLLTEKWLPSAKMLQLFTVVGISFPIYAIHVCALKALGASKKYLRIEILKQILTLGGIGATVAFGVKALIIGEAVVSVLAFFLHTFYTTRLLHYSWGEQLRDLFPFAAISGIAACVMIAVSFAVSFKPMGLLIAQVAAGSLTYLILCEAARLEAYLSLKRLVIETVSGLAGFGRQAKTA